MLERFPGYVYNSLGAGHCANCSVDTNLVLPAGLRRAESGSLVNGICDTLVTPLTQVLRFSSRLEGDGRSVQLWSTGAKRVGETKREPSYPIGASDMAGVIVAPSPIQSTVLREFYCLLAVSKRHKEFVLV